MAIDPGHGGKHPGCVNKNFLEKDITLSISLKLGELIKKNFSDVEVVYTRTTDKYVDLDERGKIANKAGADLFISIHINSSESVSPNGTSTYVMGIDKGNKNLDVAMKENDVIIYEDDYSTRYEGYTPGDPASYIMFSLMQSAYLDQSMQMAEIVQKHFAHDLPMKDLGARQGPFLVLWRTSMPAILTEIGFLSNDKDRTYITTNKGQNEAARSLFNAFSEYKSKVEGRANVVLLKPQSSLPEISGQPTPQEKAVVEAVQSQPMTVAEVQKPAEPATPKPATTQKHTEVAKSSFAESSGKQAGSQRTAEAKSQETPPQQTPLAAATKPVSPSSIRFYIQIAALGKQKSVNSADFKSYRGKVTEKKSPNGGYKYLVEGSGNYNTTASKLSTVKSVFKDAFVVAYDGDKQIPVDEARRKAK